MAARNKMFSVRFVGSRKKIINISGYNVIYAEYYGVSYIIREMFVCVCVDFINVTLALFACHFCFSAIDDNLQRDECI